MPARLMEELVRRTLIEATEAESVLTRMENESVSIDTVLLEQSLVCEKDLLQALGVAYGFATAGSKESVESVDDAVFRMFPEQLAVKYGWAPLGFEASGKILQVLCTAPPNLKTLRSVGELLELKLKPVLTTEIRVAQRQALLYNRPLSERMMNLLREGNGVGNEAIRGPEAQNGETRSSILEKQPISFTEATRQLSEAVERDRIIDIALYYVHRTFSYAALIISKKGKLKGWKAVGRQAEDIENLSIDLSTKSSFGTAFHSQAQVLGPVNDHDRNHLSILGRHHTRTLLLIPLRLGGKVFALLYVDNDSSSISPHHAAELMVFSQHVQKAMERVVLNRKDQTAGTEVLPIPVLAENSGVPESTEAHDEKERGTEPTITVRESTEPSHSPNRNDIDEDTEEIPPEALASVFENKAKESAMFDNTSGLGDTIPSPPNRATKKPEKLAPEMPAVSAKQPLVLPPFPSTILPGTLPSPARTAENAKNEETESAIENPSHKQPGFDTPQIEEASGQSLEALDSNEEFVTSFRREHSEKPTGEDFELPPIESASDQVPAAFEGHQDPTESARLQVPAALLDPKRDSLWDEISQLPSLAPPAAPFEEALLAEPKEFQSVIRGKTGDQEKYGAERPTMLAEPEASGHISEKTSPREASRPTMEAPLLTSKKRVETKREGEPKAHRSNAKSGNEEAQQEHDKEHVLLRDESRPSNPSTHEFFRFEPTQEQIDDWIEKINSEKASDRHEALQDDLARYPGVLPGLMKRFPGVVDVDTRSQGTTMPPFAKCGALLGVISEMSLEAHPFVEPFLNSTQREQRFFASYFYGHCHIVSIIPQLLRRLHDGDQIIAAAAEASLIRYKNEAEFSIVVEHLHQRLASQSLDARKRAIACLAKYKDTSVIPKLIQVLERKEKNVMSAALLALESLTRQSWGLNAKKWYSWWEKNHQRTRTAWLVDALESKNKIVREKALKELIRVSGDDFGYVATASRWGRGRSVTRWKAWLKQHT